MSGTARIKALPPEVAKQISSSTGIPSLNNVVIGLVQNALDAKASQVCVEIDYEHGSCAVEDDGLGIPPSEFVEDGGLGKPHRRRNSWQDFFGTNSSIYIQAGQ